MYISVCRTFRHRWACAAGAALQGQLSAPALIDIHQLEAAKRITRQKHHKQHQQVEPRPYQRHTWGRRRTWAAAAEAASWDTAAWSGAGARVREGLARWVAAPGAPAPLQTPSAGTWRSWHRTRSSLSKCTRPG